VSYDRLMILNDSLPVLHAKELLTLVILSLTYAGRLSRGASERSRASINWLVENVRLLNAVVFMRAVSLPILRCLRV
jgi:hypothetical protein